MFLEEWIRSRIEQETGFSSAPERAGEFTRQQLEDYQFSQLRKVIEYAYNKSTFYHNLFTREGIHPESLHSLDDLANFPFTRPSDLASNPYKFLCVSQSQVSRVFSFETSGTTGSPKKVFFTAKDLEGITDYMGVAMKGVALSAGLGSSGYRVLILLPDGREASQADLLATGINKEGGLPIRGDVTLDAERQTEAISTNKPDIVFASTSRFHRISQYGQPHYALGELGVKVIFLTSEHVSESLREQLQHLWNSQVYVHYGMTEMGLGGGIECQAHDGYHFNEADFLFEVVDPITGAALRNGEEGELVFTTLSREAMPLIRYRTGDLSRLVNGDCDCGATALRRIGGTIARVESVVKIGERKIDLPMLDEILFGIPNVVDYQPTLTTEAGKDCLTLEIELSERRPQVEQEVIEAVNKPPLSWESIQSASPTTPRIVVIEQGTLKLKRSGRGKRAILDKR